MKYVDSTKRREAMDIRERDIAQALVVHDRSHTRVEKLPTDQRVYRVKPVTHLITRIFNRIMGKFLGIIIIRDIHGKFRMNNREFWEKGTRSLWRMLAHAQLHYCTRLIL